MCRPQLRRLDVAFVSSIPVPKAISTRPSQDLQLHANAAIVGADPFFFTRTDQLVALAARHALAAIYDPLNTSNTSASIAFSHPHTVRGRGSAANLRGPW
jgi:hypothetical protein